MKTVMNMMAYTVIAGASMYGGYLIGSSTKKKRKINNSTNNNTNK